MKPVRAEKRTSDDEAKRRNAAIAAALEKGKDPVEVAAIVVEAIYARRFWVLSHPEYLRDIRHRNESLHRLENPSLLRSMFKED